MDLNYTQSHCAGLFLTELIIKHQPCFWQFVFFHLWMCVCGCGHNDTDASKLSFFPRYIVRAYRPPFVVQGSYLNNAREDKLRAFSVSVHFSSAQKEPWVPRGSRLLCKEGTCCYCKGLWWLWKKEKEGEEGGIGFKETVALNVMEREVPSSKCSFQYLSFNWFDRLRRIDLQKLICRWFTGRQVFYLFIYFFKFDWWKWILMIRSTFCLLVWIT